MRFACLTFWYFATQSKCDGGCYAVFSSVAVVPSGRLLNEGASVLRRSTHLGLWFCLLSVPIVQADAPLDLHGFRGRVVYLDFWASWCGPCRQSFPWMQTMKSTYEVQGLTVIAVNLDTNRAEADKFLNRFHPTFEVRFDPRGDLGELYKVQGM